MLQSPFLRRILYCLCKYMLKLISISSATLPTLKGEEYGEFDDWVVRRGRKRVTIVCSFTCP